MVRVSVRFDLDAFTRNVNVAGRRRVNKAAAIALGRVGTTVRKEASLTIRERLAIKASVAKNQITLRRVGPDGLTLFIEAKGQPIPLRDFQARQGKRGVSYRVSKAAGRKVYETKFGKGFIIQRFGGHVFAPAGRDPKGPQKAKLRKIYGPSVPQFFVTKAIIEKLERIARQRWPIEFARAFNGLRVSGRA
ncbi:MAG TPA: phage tail protein [Aquabacterium sp.]|nr:phage tail protein [Aquabacterium sp.]